MKVFRAAFFISFSLIFNSLLAQGYYRLLEAEYEYGPNHGYEDFAKNSFDIQEHEVNLSLPIQFESKDAVVVGLGYNQLQLFDDIQEFDRAPDTVISDDYTYTRLRSTLGYSKFIDDRTSFVLIGFYRIASDFQNVSSRDFLWGGLGMVTRKVNDKFTLKYGMYANTEHYGWLLIPVVGCDWQVSEHWRIFGVLPRRLTAMHTISERVRTGFIFEAPNRSYRLSQETSYKRNLPPVPNEPLDLYVNNIKNVLYVYGEYYLTKSLVIRGRVGYTLFREIQLYEYDDKPTFITWGIEYGAERTPIADVPAFRPMEDGIVLNASLEYRFSLE